MQLLSRYVEITSVYLSILAVICTVLHGIISSPLMTQGGQPCKQQNSAQGGPPCAAYLLRWAVRPPNSKMVRRADSPVQHIFYAGRSALLTAKMCAGLTALCSTFATQGSPPSYQQNGMQGGPPCASYKLCRAVRPPTSKMFHSQGSTIFQGQGEIKSIPEDDCLSNCKG